MKSCTFGPAITSGQCRPVADSGFCADVHILTGSADNEVDDDSVTMIVDAGFIAPLGNARDILLAHIDGILARVVDLTRRGPHVAALSKVTRARSALSAAMREWQTTLARTVVVPRAAVPVYWRETVAFYGEPLTAKELACMYRCSCTVSVETDRQCRAIVAAIQEAVAAGPLLL